MKSNFKLTKNRIKKYELTKSIFVILGMLNQSIAQAQSPERIEVIGSRISRSSDEGPSPVKNIGHQELEKSGNTRVSDSLRESNASSFGVSRESAGSSASATSNIGLRGLGSTRTLVLLNGHRLPKDPDTEAVDLNLIPTSAIERVEILKDGASALYGSDALGGVLNIITKKGINSSEFSEQISFSESKGGQTQSSSLLSGVSSDRSDFLTVLNFSRTEKILGRDREATKKGLSSIGAVASFQDASGNWTIDPNGTCSPEYIRTVNGGQKCFFPYNEIATTRPEINQINLMTDYNLRIDGNLQFYNRNLVVLKDIEWNYAPAPGVFDTPTGTTSQPTARRVSYRFMEAGNRDNQDSERNFNTLFGLKGFFADGWEWNLSTGYGRIVRENLGVNGYLDSRVVDSLIKSGAFDPLAPVGARGDISSAIVQTYQQSKSSLFTTELVFSGELGNLESGPLGMAIGVSAWSEKLDQQTDSKSAAGVVIGSGGTNNKGSREVTSAFTELSLPMSSKLEMQLAARMDQYSDFGNSVNPKIAAKYKMDGQTLGRASIGTGFKAPTLSQLYSGSSDGFVQFIDRKACANNAASCTADQYHIIGGGNRDLKEEKALTGGMGVVLDSPKSGVSTSLDLWMTKISNVVGIDFEDLTQAELAGVDPAQYGVSITRDQNGAIDTITAPNLNLQKEEISGLDLEVSYSPTEILKENHLTFKNEFSYMFFYKREGFPGAGSRDVLGEWGFPHWRNVLSLSADLLADANLNLILSLRTIPGQNVIDRERNEKINDMNEFDLMISYSLSKNTRLSGGVKNILNSAPPMDANGGTGGAAVVNDSLYDINGRRMVLGLASKF